MQGLNTCSLNRMDAMADVCLAKVSYRFRM
jgi:hypothetical protein